MITPRHTPRSWRDAPSSAGRQFTDRIDFITAFEAAMAAPRPPHRVLVYYGVGGIGKTTLRKELARRFGLKPTCRRWSRTGRSGSTGTCPSSTTTPCSFRPLR